MKKIDITNKTEKIKLNITKSNNFEILPKELSDIDIKKDIIFNFNTSNTNIEINFRAIAQQNTSINLNILLKTSKKEVKDIKCILNIYILNLYEENDIKIIPALEIGHEQIEFEHKVAIGIPNNKWIKYLTSRGLTYNQSLNLILQGFKNP